MTELQKEMRKILLGYIKVEDGKITAGKGVFSRLNGPPSGVGSARILGLLDTKRRYSRPEGSKDWLRQCRDAFYGMGKRVSLANAPSAEAVLYSPLLYNPSILIAEFTQDEMTLTVYTARTATTAINAFHAFNEWERKMPQKQESERVPREKKVKSERRQRKLDKKQERKDNRKEKRKKRLSKIFGGFKEVGIIQDVKSAVEDANEMRETLRATEDKKPGKPRHGK